MTCQADGQFAFIDSSECSVACADRVTRRVDRSRRRHRGLRDSGDPAIRRVDRSRHRRHGLLCERADCDTGSHRRPKYAGQLAICSDRDHPNARHERRDSSQTFRIFYRRDPVYGRDPGLGPGRMRVPAASK